MRSAARRTRTASRARATSTRSSRGCAAAGSAARAGTARRPRTDERAEPSRPAPATPADSLRQLVHELRTPTNAIAGFAEMIETQILGPVPEPEPLQQVPSTIFELAAGQAGVESGLHH